MEPHAEYRRRLEERRNRARERERIHAWTGNTRFGIAILGGLAVFASLVLEWFPIGWIAIAVVLFLGLSIVHQRVTRALRRAKRAAQYYERGIARLEERWVGQGDDGSRYIDEAHPCALDLDLFGRASLFERLSTARTRRGADLLADWLREPATPAEVRERQAAVSELRERLDLREDLAILGADVPSGVDLEGLVQWGETAPILSSVVLRVLALVLAILGTVGVAHWALTYDWILLAPFATAEALFALALATRVRAVIKPLERRVHDLAVFHGVLARLEQETFTSARLARLRASLGTQGPLPSARIAQLLALIELLDSKRNPYFAPFAAVFLWGTQLAFALEKWRQQAGPHIRGWLTAVAEFEALSALATYAYENPNDPFPELVESGRLIHGVGMGHPLLPGCVRNDVRLDEELRLLIISGSNMSGKSTLLRTLGINTVLAQAGAPVRARSLQMGPMIVGATLRVQDSLQAGRSRFYAEVLRVRQLVEMSRGDRPLLFLLDELFAGTNSHDRRLGAEAVVCGLVESGAIGLVTTHDLALTQIVDSLGNRATNVHFEDRLENGTMTFDYHMRPGVVQHSNALELMRSVGLKV